MGLLKKYFIFIICVAVCFFAIKPLLSPGFFPIHDDEQVGRLFELNNSLMAGHIPPRISQNLGFGYGYPFFNFYPSFSYYVAEIFKLAGFSYIDSIKLMVGLGFILSGLFMYLFSKEYLGRAGGLVAAVLYIYAPYHSVDVYVRGAFPEFWAFVFIPAIFWAFHNFKEKRTLGYVLLAGILCATLVLTHNLIAMMAVPFIGLYVIMLFIQANKRKNFALGVILSGIIALTLSAYFWIPAILENKYTMVSLLTTQLASYNLHFVSLRQFFNSRWGYGGSILGPLDGFSLELGKIHIALAGFTLAAVVAFLLRKKKLPILSLFIIFLILSLFLQTYYSKPIWALVQPLSYIQFPWRFMLFSVFAASFLGGYVVLLVKNRNGRILLSSLIILVALVFYSPLFKPSKHLNVNDSYYTNLDTIKWKTSRMAFEYVPKGIATKNSSLNTTVVDIDESEVSHSPFEVLEGDLQVKVNENKPQSKRFEASSLEGGLMQINTFSFPGWIVFMDGKEIGYNDENKLKLIQVEIPKGTHLISAEFRDTPLRKMSNLLTLLGLIGVILIIPFYSKKIINEKA